MTGSGVVNNDLKHVVTGDRLRVNIIAVLAIFAVLVVTMRSIILPFILVMIIETAIWINMSISFITGSTLFYISYLIVSPIQLGATVDYAILFTQRYTENRKVLGLSPSESIVQTIKDNTVSILTSGLTLSVIGFPELVNTAKNVIAVSFKSLQTWAVVAVMYLIVILTLSRCAKMLERRLNRGR